MPRTAVPAPRAFLPLLLALLLTGGRPQASDVVYDVYVKGIADAELVVSGPPGERTWRIRTRDRAANRWRAPHAAAERAVAGDSLFLLPGAIRRLASDLAQLERIDWRGLHAVAWPDTGTVYVRHRELAGRVEGRTVTVTRWAARDASRPMDLVVDGDNRVVAGLDVAADVVLVRRGYEEFTTVAAWRAPGISPAAHGFRLAHREMVAMPDGVRLATLVYLPDGAPGPFPAIFIRTPYGISGLINQHWHYAARGYALVFQATRGTAYWDPANRSEGVWEPMIHEPTDGAAALGWLARQPWSDGQVCMQGGSYVGYTQWTLTMARHPALKCLVPESSMGTAFSDQPFWGGTLVEGMAYYMLYMLDRPLLPGRTWSEVLRHRPLVDIDRYATGQEVPQWDTLLAHTRNDAYWRRQDWYRDPGPRAFSAFQISGWFDDDLPGTTANWALMQQRGRGPQRLLLGPWKHGYNADRRLNGYSFGPDALRDDVWLLKQQWYDHILRGRDTGVDRVRVEYFVLGRNEWRTAAAWPPPEAREESWYLRSDGHAARVTTRGRLERTPPAAPDPPDRYVYDPAAAPPNWYSFDQMQRWEDVQTFPYDFRDIEARPDVAVYTSAPLEADLTIAGHPLLVLHASTQVRDTDWWVHLADVDTTGRSTRISVGVIRARFRHNEDPRHGIFGVNFETERLLSGDSAEVVRYEVGLRAVAATLRKGHRLRVAVMNAMDNYSFPNSNTGLDETTVTATVPGRMALHKGPAHPSRIVLPVLPR
jgi:uncharacterized protein